ncbi:Ras-like GTP-binding protein RhoL [Gryllus bimaculatus]|nr:Ras-like GTP-binding protein RhoL [Gryllus bimaculatus]
MTMSPDVNTTVCFPKGPPDINIVIVGDSYVGKTSLLKTFVTHEYSKNYEGPSLERYFEDITVDGQDFHLILWEPIALESYDKMREFIYGKAECIIVCYAVNDLESFQRVSTFWCPEIQKYCQDTPILLAALKADLRDQNFKCISRSQGKDLKCILNASGFVECSSFLGIGLKDVFVKAIQCVLKEEKCKIKHCSDCNTKFDFLRRKHHCRRCGRIYCGSCCDTRIGLPRMCFVDPVRVCEKCAAVTNKENDFFERQLKTLTNGATFLIHSIDKNSESVICRLSSDHRYLIFDGTSTKNLDPVELTQIKSVGLSRDENSGISSVEIVYAHDELNNRKLKLLSAPEPHRRVSSSWIVAIHQAFKLLYQQEIGTE